MFFFFGYPAFDEPERALYEVPPSSHIDGVYGSANPTVYSGKQSDFVIPYPLPSMDVNVGMICLVVSS